MQAIEISRSGLDVEWRRLQVIAENIANLNTTRTADGGSYLPRRLLSGPVEGQAEEMALMIKATRSYEANLVALAAAQQMYSSALQVGRQS